MNEISSDPPPSPLEQATRPLLQLAQNISGMESTFVTSIHWDARNQTILFANNQGPLDVMEGATLDWHDSMCRSLLLAGVEQTCAVGTEVIATPWAVSNRIQAFFAVPLVSGETAIGTICGASQQLIVLDQAQMDALHLIAETLQRLLEVERHASVAHARAEAAELDAVEARSLSRRQSAHSRDMERLAYTDALTGLPNRRAFMARWSSEVARSTREDTPIGLMLLDADRFKAVNDTGGHAMGDAVLRAIGASLAESAAPPDVVARLGGDEFALMTTRTESTYLEDLASRIGCRFQLAATEMGVDTTLSIGMVSSEHCPRAEMLVDADQALYCSKEAGGNGFRSYFCDGSKHEPARTRAPSIGTLGRARR